MNGLAIRACVALGVIVSVAGPVPAKADVGRFFFTPAERAAFEQARRAEQAAHAGKPVESEPEVISEAIELVPDEPGPTITVDGYVRRSNGQATLWVNGENSYDGDLSASRIDPGTVQVRGGEVSVTPMKSNAPIKLKPGQSFDPNSATITDCYETPIRVDEFAGD
jgi:hypothetical protein